MPLIDRDKAIEAILYLVTEVYDRKTAESILEDVPIVDAEPVVRCKDCDYYNAREEFCEYLSNNYAPAVDMEENDFCSKGKRREDAEID